MSSKMGVGGGTSELSSIKKVLSKDLTSRKEIDIEALALEMYNVPLTALQASIEKSGIGGNIEGFQSHPDVPEIKMELNRFFDTRNLERIDQLKNELGIVEEEKPKTGIFGKLIPKRKPKVVVPVVAKEEIAPVVAEEQHDEHATPELVTEEKSHEKQGIGTDPLHGTGSGL